MSAQIKQYYPQESVPDDQVLIEFDNEREATIFKDWFRAEGRSLYYQYKDEQTEWDDWD